MTPALVRLPTTVLADDGCVDELAACARHVGTGRTVVVGAQRTAEGHALDEFVVATALAHRAPEVAFGIAARVGAGRAASVVAREATCAQLLGACHALVLDGDHATCAAAARIVTALFEPGPHTVAAGAERIVDALNLPLPTAVPSVRWARGDELMGLGEREPLRVGEVIEVAAGDPLPERDGEVLFVLVHPVGRPAALAATLAR